MEIIATAVLKLGEFIIATAVLKLGEFTAGKLELLSEARKNAAALQEELRWLEADIDGWKKREALTDTEKLLRSKLEDAAQKTVAVLDDYQADYMTKFSECVQYCIPTSCRKQRNMFDIGEEILTILKTVKADIPRIKACYCKGEQGNVLNNIYNINIDNIDKNNNNIIVNVIHERVAQRLPASCYYGPNRTIDGSHDEQKIVMLEAKQLTIAWGTSPEYWSFTSDPAASSFSEVAKLKGVCWLDINCSVDSKNLLKERKYGAYLVFKLADGSYGLESVVGYVRPVNHETQPEAVKTARLLHLQSSPTKRTDGWMEAKLGELFTKVDNDGPVEARVLELSDDWKSGLIVAGIEFRADINF